MTQYEVSKKVDYLSFTTQLFQPLDDMLGSPKQTNPRIGNYNKAEIFDCGLIHQWHTHNKALKHHVICSGSTMDILREYGFSDVQILEWAIGQKSVNIKRLDIAVTSKPMDAQVHGLTPMGIYRETKGNNLKSKLKPDKPAVDTELQVETMYIGSRKRRDPLFRAYDKNLERDENSMPNYLIRYELETRSGAITTAKRLIQGQDIGGIIRSKVDFPDNETWIKIMDSVPTKNVREDNHKSESEKLEEKIDSRWHWMLTTIAPLLGSLLAETEFERGTDDRERLLTAFDKIVEFEYYKSKK